MREGFCFRLAGILKLRKKAGESSSTWFLVVFFSLFPSPEFSCVHWVGKCLMKNLIEFLFFTFLFSLLQGYVFNIPIDELFNCSSFLLWCRYRCIGAIVSSKVHVFYLWLCFFHFQLCACLMTAKEDSSARLNLHESFSAASKL